MPAAAAVVETPVALPVALPLATTAEDADPDAVAAGALPVAVPDGIVIVTPLCKQRAWATWIVLATSAGEQAFWMTGRRLLMKAWFLQMQPKSDGEQPVLAREEMAALV